MDTSTWGPLAARYGELRPRKMLTLDGGGIRGALTLAILENLEDQLREHTGSGDDFRLCQFFDYIGGTSTGAIISAGLAIGMSVKELSAFYKKTGPMMFEKPWLLKRWKNLYKSEPLAEELKKVFGVDRTLEAGNLECLLLVVTRNVSTDSPWPISSNPDAKYNDTTRDDCNLRIPLWQLVRASTAAPIYFPPEVLNWDPKDEDSSFVFVDGGMTPYNNPAFLMYRMATLDPFNLRWPTGEKNLMLVSVGTGNAANVVTDEDAGGRNLAQNLASLPGDLMYASSVDQDLNCRTVGRCVAGHKIDSELGDLIPHAPIEDDLGRDFLYARYDADLSKKGLTALGFPDLESAAVTKLDSVAALDDLVRIGHAIGKTIDLSPFEAFFQPVAGTA